MEIRVIVVPTDFSADSEAALEHAIELASQLGAQLHLLHAYTAWVPATMGGGPVSIGEFVQAARDTAQGRLEALAQRVVQRGVPCQVHLSADAPVSAILELASELPAQLIAMGTRGLTGLKHALLGSVAERIVRLASCPVLTVKPGA